MASISSGADDPRPDLVAAAPVGLVGVDGARRGCSDRRMRKPALAAVAVAALLCFPSAALADHNDSFASARDGQADLVLDEEAFDDNLNFDTEPTELLECDGSFYGSTAWFRFRAERTGLHVVTTFGSNFDTVLSVYSPNGAAIPSAAQQIGCNDDADPPSDTTSFVDFTAQAGQFYYVQVGGYDDAGAIEEGDITVAAYQPPPNDNRASAQQIGAGGGVQGYNFNAVEEPGEALICDTSDYAATTWYKVAVPAVGDASVSVISTDFDPVVAIFPANSNTPIACNDDAPGETKSAFASGRVSPGDYYIQVGGYQGDQGTYEVRVSFTEDTDLDDDGIPRDRDCNDRDRNIRPGAPEVVNNDIDENCDGVKEYDRDGDGSRVPGNPADCDDGNPARSPLKPEIPGNRIDENCDNVVTPFPAIPSHVAAVFSDGTRLLKLSVFTARKGSTLTMRCRGRGCRFRTKSVKIKRNAKELRFEKRLSRRQREFKPRQRLVFTLSGPRWSSRIKLYIVRGNGKFPRFEEYCVKNGQRATC
jgi:hypothetical protein